MTTQTLEPQTQAIPLEEVISTNMRLALALRKKNQSDLSRALGVSSGLVSQKMHGTTAWTISDMEKAGQFLKIAPAKFLEPNGLLVAGHGFEPWTGGSTVQARDDLLRRVGSGFRFLDLTQAA